MRFLDCIDVNPKISLEKGKIAPFIEMGNVSTIYRNPVAVESKPFDSGVKFQDGDTVIARITPCLQNGKRFYCKNIGTGFGSTEFLVFRPKNESVDNLYLYYFMKTEFIRQSMINSMVGATGRQRVNNDVFKNIEVNFPNKEKQREIGRILSAYDGLIENNQKQIKLLEEAAQRLYKEWFVDLRFPGYENTPIIDGVPEGWEEKPLSEVFKYVRGKSYTSKDIVDNGSTFMINLKNIRPFGGYKRNAEKHFIGEYSKAQQLKYGDIVMGVTDMTKERRLVGHVAMIPDIGKNITFSMDLIKIIPLIVPNSFLYSSMIFGGYSNKIAALANGVNVLHLKPDAIMNLKMIIPSKIIMRNYDNMFKLYYNKLEKLQNQSILLAEARDRLLPKLMSGKLEV